MSHIQITGASGSAPRLEISDLIKNTDQFSLYIQALAKMFSTNEATSTSHFLLGGIHGLPYEQWEISGSDEASGIWEGYCTHGTVLFPTWHRPYVALYEQVLQTHAKEIAKTYTVDPQRWAAAADTLRAPYWDWAVNVVPPDEVIANPKVTITTPDGKQSSVDNPLWGYLFQSKAEPGFEPPLSLWPKTLRHPNNSTASATDDVASLKSTLKSEASQITNSVYQLLAFINTWPEMSNHTTGMGTGNSLETIHDNIHVLVGAAGHMSFPAYAGMDPIFFLHHANVDRLFALWQALHDQVWVSTGAAASGTWTIESTDVLDATTGLTPFWNGPTTYWISSDVRDWTVLGYDYPEFQGLDRSDPDAVRTAIGQIVNDLYLNGSSRATVNFLSGAAGDPASSVTGVSKEISTKSSAPAEGQQQFVAGTGAAQGSRSNVDVAAAYPTQGLDTNVYNWTARVRTKLHELGGPFSVFVFLGPIPENAAEWRASPSFVGAHHAFVNNLMSRCANCQNQADAEIESFVHLTDAIVARSNLGSLAPSVVEPYMKAAPLGWRIQKVDGTVVPVTDIPSLEVTVVCKSLTRLPGDMFPRPGQPRTYPNITIGRPGGHRTAA